MVSTSSLKKLLNREKCYFQMVTTLIFDLKLLSKLFSKMVIITNFWCKHVIGLCLAFPENGLNLVTQIIPEKRNMPFSIAQNICFWPHTSFKSIFKNSLQNDLNSFEVFTLLYQPDNDFNFITQKISQNWKISFQTFRINVFQH